jgi:hypothetical protein
MKRFFLSTLLGALAAYFWGSVSWMVLSWHDEQTRSFTNESAIIETIKAGAPEPGIYFLPGMAGRDQTQWADAVAEGPFLMATVRPGSSQRPMWKPMLSSFLAHVLAAFIITILLRVASIFTYGGRVVFTAALGFLAGILGHLPAWTWWEVPGKWTAILMADLVIAWLLAGFVMAAFTPPPRRMY